MPRLEHDLYQRHATIVLVKPLVYAGSGLCLMLAASALALGVWLILDKALGIDAAFNPPGPLLVVWVAVFLFGWAGSRLWAFAETGGAQPRPNRA
jgi:hypothetical protein